MNLQYLIKKYENHKVNAKEVITSTYTNKNNLILLERNNVLNEKIINNLDILLEKVNMFRELYGKPFIITSGFRQPEYNQKIGGVKNSLHCLGLACDILDKNGDIDKFCLENLDFFTKNNCAFEHPYYTHKWCHFQAILSKKGNKCFVPYVGQPKEQDKDERFKYLIA
jgi:hypothetical protein